MFANNIKNYGLHDCEINDIFINRDKICFLFKKGIYKLDKTGKEISLTNKCLLEFEIDILTSQDVSSCVEVMQIYKNKLKEMDLDRFVKMLKGSSFDIENDFYSFFDRGILLKGYIGKFLVCVNITNIYNVNVIFK